MRLTASDHLRHMSRQRHVRNCLEGDFWPPRTEMHLTTDFLNHANCKAFCWLLYFKYCLLLVTLIFTAIGKGLV